jgi:hypothetical protein
MENALFFSMKPYDWVFPSEHLRTGGLSKGSIRPAESTFARPSLVRRNQATQVAVKPRNRRLASCRPGMNSLVRDATIGPLSNG